MWTLRGWKETDKDGNEIMVAEEIPKPKSVEEVIEKRSNDDENAIATEMSNVCKTSWSNLEGQDSVRNVFKRGCYIHCPNKALIFMRFAAFEESCLNFQESKDILLSLLAKYPLLIEASMQLIDLERRSGNLDIVTDLYKKLIKKIPQNRKSLKTWLSMKLSRFQFKVANEPDKALATLRLVSTLFRI